MNYEGSSDSITDYVSCLSLSELDKYFDRVLNEDSYKYKFNDKIHEEEKKVEKDDKGNIKEEMTTTNKRMIPKTVSLEELEKQKNEDEKKKLVLINIKKLEEELPNLFIKKDILLCTIKYI